MASVSCRRSDTALLACSYDPNTSENNHGEDAGVRCGGEGCNSYTRVNLGFEKEEEGGAKVRKLMIIMTYLIKVCSISAAAIEKSSFSLFSSYMYI